MGFFVVAFVASCLKDDHRLIDDEVNRYDYKLFQVENLPNAAQDGVSDMTEADLYLYILTVYKTIPQIAGGAAKWDIAFGCTATSFLPGKNGTAELIY